MENDFISRQAAIRIVCDDECEDCPDGGCDMYRRLKRLPAADVRPVVHGEWVYEEPNGANNFKGCYWCDQCHQPINHKKNFCPNCGADMREQGAEGGA